jgi:hypothetical protein
LIFLIHKPVRVDLLGHPATPSTESDVRIFPIPLSKAPLVYLAFLFSTVPIALLPYCLIIFIIYHTLNQNKDYSMAFDGFKKVLYLFVLIRMVLDT